MKRQTFSTSEVASVVTIAAIAGTIPALQPMLLGALLNEGKITAGTMGHAATVEGLGTLIATAVAGAWLPPRRLTLIATFALLAVIAANILTVMLPAAGVTALRGLAGLGNGVLLWLFLCMIPRSEVPARYYGIFITVTASLVFLLSIALGTFAIDRFGAAAGYVIFMAIYVLLLIAARFVPNNYVEIDSGGTAMPPPWGFMGILGVALYMTGVMAFWVYSVPLGAEAGLSTKSMQMIIAAATGVQIVAGLASIVLAPRLTGLQVLVATTAASLVAMFVTMTSGSILVWSSAVLIFAFCWIFGAPFHVAFLMLADPSRRAAVFVGTAQLLGYAIGPLLASAVVSTSDYRPAQLVTMVCYAAVLVIAAAIHLKARRTKPLEDGAVLRS